MTQTSPGDKERFLQSFGWPFLVVFLDSTGYYSFDDGTGRLARIDFATRGTAGRMEGLRVTILDSLCGSIDSKLFAFDDYLSERSDDSRDYPLGGNPTFTVVTHVAWDWHVARPATTAPLVQAISRHIENFKLPLPALEAGTRLKARDVTEDSIVRARGKVGRLANVRRKKALLILDAEAARGVEIDPGEEVEVILYAAQVSARWLALHTDGHGVLL